MFLCCGCVFVCLLTVCDDDVLPHIHILSIRINFGIWIECAVRCDRLKEKKLHSTFNIQPYECSISKQRSIFIIPNFFRRSVSKSARITGSLKWWLFTFPLFFVLLSFVLFSHFISRFIGNSLFSFGLFTESPINEMNRFLKVANILLSLEIFDFLNFS